jgi:hypothetical protein
MEIKTWTRASGSSSSYFVISLRSSGRLKRSHFCLSLYLPRPNFNFFVWQLLCLLGVGLLHPYPPWTRWSSPKTKSKDKVTLVLGEIFFIYHWEGCIGSMQCNVKFGYQLSICSGTKANHGVPWSSWAVAGPSWCKLTSNQQSGIKPTNPNILP